MKARFLLLFLMVAPVAMAQTSGSGYPPFVCSSSIVTQTYKDTANNLIYTCVNNGIAGYIWQLGQSPILPVTSAPNGSCTAGIPDQQVTTTGILYSCQSGTWTAFGTGTGSGTVSGQASGVIPLATAATTIGAQSHLSDNGTAVSSSLPVAFQDTTTQVSAAYRTPGITVSPYCPSGSTTCIKVNADGQMRIDATSNSSTTITCPDCNFTSAVTGMKGWVTTLGSGSLVGINFLYTTTVCPVGTLTYVNATTVTSSATCTANASGNGVIYWGHDDGATLATIDANMGCQVVHISSGNNLIFTSKGFFNTPPTTACPMSATTSLATTGAPYPSLVGDGFGASQAFIVMTPDFDFTSCKGVTGASKNVCFGGAARTHSNVQIQGTGLHDNANCANGTNTIIASAWPYSSVMYGVDVSGVCPGTSGMEGVEVQSADEAMDLGGAQDVGTIACAVYGAKQSVLRSNDCYDPDISGSTDLYVSNGATVTALTNIPIGNVMVTGSGTQLASINSSYSGNGSGKTVALEVQSGAKFLSFNDVFLNNPVLVDSGGTVQTEWTTFVGLTNNGTVISGRGNKYSQVPTGTGVWAGDGIITGYCTGTATSSSTLGLFGAGQFAAVTCTSTTVNQGVPMQIVPLSGSVNHMSCTATHAGVSASSGVVTVMKMHNGTNAATTLTCTIGTGTSCTDYTHFDVPAVGDSYGFQFTTQGSEVLAGLNCTLLNW